ncbi:MAG TPA: branched-chain amino acid ABC transporter permease, partial [Ktedonobacterales bacterium]|nr:branched-chain amino acid ABC transporter permease [Ktedonobacterales bacterium]
NRIQLSILVTFAVALIIEGILSDIFTTNYRQMHTWYTDQSLHVLNFYLPYIYVFAFLLSAVLLGGLYILLYLTTFGRSLRATMENRTAAQLIGINVERVSAITFGIGVALTAAGGMAFGATNSFDPGSSYDLISRLLVIIILGGMGSLGGALIASLGMLVIEDIIAVVWSPTWSSTVFFALIVLLLVFRPQGLLGKLATRSQ